MKLCIIYRWLFVVLCVIAAGPGSLARRKQKTRTRSSAARSEDPSSSCQVTCGANQHLDTATCRCECDKGYRTSTTYADRCDDINECREYPTRCKGTCTNQPGTFECRCRYGFVLHTNGWDCYKAPKILPCFGLVCYGGARLDINRCRCDCGRGMRYNFITEECEDIDECEEMSHNCEHGCINTNRGYICYCDVGFSINADNRTCRPLPAKSNSLPCGGIRCNPGTALDAYHCECVCEEGYFYKHRTGQCTDVNECREFEDWCDGTCRNEPIGSYTCTCPAGKELDKDGWTCNTIQPPPSGANWDNCSPDHFMCENRMRCIRDELVCDGYGDCPDRSDEANCKESCNSQDFSCANGETCLHRDSVCDSNNDCEDWSDELDCGCRDERDECGAWELRGECESNPGWMNWHCRLSCGQCVEGDGTANGTLSETTEPSAYFIRHSMQYATYLQYTRRNRGERPGASLNTWQCKDVTEVPRHVRVNLGLSPYYQKYTNAYSIPIVASSRVSDEAVMRACYVVRVMLADRRELRQKMYDKFARVAVLAENELTLHLPEHSHLPERYNDLVRSLGGTLYIPLASAAEENLLCRPDDRWANEDTFVHSFALSLLRIALSSERQYQKDLNEAYFNARRSGLWTNTRTDDSMDVYFADGVQSYFSVQAPTLRGVHSGVDTREKLERYDPALYKLIHEVFPCRNRLVDRCGWDSTAESPQIYVNCGESMYSAPTTESPTLVSESPESECVDKHRDCDAWAENGECSGNTEYMTKNCALSCGVCTPPEEPEPQQPDPDPQVGEPEPNTPADPYAECIDTETHCQDWARRGECEINPAWMRPNCRRACHACDDDPNCYDSSNNCAEWAQDGECEKNQSYMESHCMLSCGVC
ncbi:uncharacterized protein [Diadema setosum]|uniref:uncharacterized protein n=1 Tax=Diadema setosum TaxID=31175 RepID=UPI003B3BD73A